MKGQKWKSIVSITLTLTGIAEMIDIVKHVEQKLDKEFDRVVLTSDEWFALRDLILVLKKENERLRWQITLQD